MKITTNATGVNQGELSGSKDLLLFGVGVDEAFVFFANYYSKVSTYLRQEPAGQRYSQLQSTTPVPVSPPLVPRVLKTASASRP